ncbi:DNA polymerase III subunit delta [Candidatus Pelagibacter sp. HIMB1495]|uniref:DNA polymerase III subunit delta n=1 Tax=unclassified Candidatus Pelagibacter TaxID=2647897 RepID=UPI003F8595E0
MIIKSFETKKININKNNIILMYGKNEGFKKEIIKNLILNVEDISSYEEKEIIESPNIFFDSILNKSLFTNQKLIIIKRATDKILKILEKIFDSEIQDIIIINADNLDKKSKLRSIFEKDKKLVCIPFYPDNHQTLSKIASDFFKKRNISISQSNINQIIDKSAEQRENLLNELEKIETFSFGGKVISNNVIENLINLRENHSILELVDLCLIKNKSKLIRVLNENIYSNEDCIIILRTLLNRSKQILRLSKEFERNNNIDLTISTAKPPIFWKEKEKTKQIIQIWKSQSLKKLIYKINNVELIVKKSLYNSLNLVVNFLLEQSSGKTSS